MGLFAQECFSSTRDQNPILADILYYGQLEDIVEVIYGFGKPKQCTYTMFKVRWCPAKKQKDHYGFTLVNLHREVYTDEKFIFAEQADQCFFVRDPNVISDWVVLYKEPRSVVLPNNNEKNIEESEYNYSEPIGSSDDVWQEFSYAQNVALDVGM
ncbi:uncharacterized protein LOC109847701 [Asparagus officinalis]|uniref:uncharacterized protein LOC109847701 n=1 Tax=Asparagus officinalis TaxID=4686 RepID=UPI00098DE752|nr:uncharacterized protein LOC109847701 [Asparagus officinalis]